MMYTLRRFLIGFFILMSWGCHQEDASNKLKIGVVAGPETALIHEAAAIAKTDGLSVKVMEFNDYHLLNQALNEGSIDANIFQHLPYLQAAVEAHHYNLTVLGKTFVFPMGIYSKKIKSLEQLPLGATIAIPNDPSNGTRALLLLQSAGIIAVKHHTIITKADILENPRQVVIKEMDAAQLPRVLEDVDLGVINTNFALLAGLKLYEDGLFFESKDSPYANLMVIKAGSSKKKALSEFLKIIQSEAIKKKAAEIFGEAAIPAAND